MTTFRPFRAGHLKYLSPQAEQSREHAALVASGGASALEGSLALSAWRGPVCVGAAGLIHVRSHRACAWALLGYSCGAELLALTRKMKHVIRDAGYARVEFTVAEGFDNGHRFARLLGAVLETPEPMQCFGAFGGAEYMYAVLKRGNASG